MSSPLTPVRCLLADDEPLARERLRALLHETDADVDVVAEASGGEEAASLIREHELDVIFLDVQMPVLDGFDVVDLLPERDRRPHVVFVTAHDEYATVAFEVRALDYLTKPVRLRRLNETLRRVRETSLGTDDRLPSVRDAPRDHALRRSTASENASSSGSASAEQGPKRPDAELDRTGLGDLIYRRVPQVLAGYLGVTWTLFELTQWMGQQYPVPKHLGRMVLFGLLLFLPSVLLVTYRHGRPGPDQWTQVEQATVAGNLIVAALVLLAVFGGIGLGL